MALHKGSHHAHGTCLSRCLARADIRGDFPWQSNMYTHTHHPQRRRRGGGPFTQCPATPNQPRGGGRTLPSMTVRRSVWPLRFSRDAMGRHRSATRMLLLPAHISCT